MPLINYSSQRQKSANRKFAWIICFLQGPVVKTCPQMVFGTYLNH